MSYFEAGAPALFRTVWHGKVKEACAVTVVVDGPERTVLYLPAGTRMLATSAKLSADPRERQAAYLAEMRTHEWVPVQTVWTGTNVLIDLEPDSWYSAWRFFDAATGAFLRWYVNFQVPFRRSAVGFDTLDLFLDLEITPDLVSRDKDRDDYEQAMRLGLFGDDVRTAVDRARREVLRRVERTAYPFRGIDTEWRPEAGWGPAELPERCDVEVVTTDEWSPPRT